MGMLHHGRIALDFGLPVALIHPSAWNRSAWNRNSQNFAGTEFSEVQAKACNSASPHPGQPRTAANRTGRAFAQKSQDYSGKKWISAQQILQMSDALASRIGHARMGSARPRKG